VKREAVNWVCFFVCPLFLGLEGEKLGSLGAKRLCFKSEIRISKSETNSKHELSKFKTGIIVQLAVICFPPSFFVLLLLLYLDVYYTINGWNVKFFVLGLLMFFARTAMILTVGQFTVL